MVFKDCTYMHQPCSNILSYVGVTYVMPDLLIGKEQSLALHPPFDEK